jgi:hypothetical protein
LNLIRKKNILILIFFVIVFLKYFPKFEYSGGVDIKDALSDGNGKEFVGRVLLSKRRFGNIDEAYNWVVNNMIYEDDPNPPDVWSTALKTYLEIKLKGKSEGDCEDYAILLCSILRFHTNGDFGHDRVWVVVQQNIGGDHAFVEYVDNESRVWLLDPVNKLKKEDSPSYKYKFNDKTVIPNPLDKKDKDSNHYLKHLNSILNSLISPILLVIIPIILFIVIEKINFSFFIAFIFLYTIIYFISVFLY